ncbi:hypothetical protein GCM10009665_19440 [Kitasatospora nipponensis]|uniref:N-acetyltransferase domain-containing protein n=1 Tax=Kitasatospora nipponensis TaxID=258049 RepID=A0ABN1VZW9_9ACTN
MVPDLARAWVAGWVVSRRTAPPVAVPWGLWIEVGLPDHVARHVLPETDERTVRAAAAAVTVPGTWLKAFRAPRSVAGWLGPGWVADDPAFLMAADLRRAAVRAPVRAPEGYRLSTATHDGVALVRVLAADGATAAHGQVATVAGTAVVDQVGTEPAHRRRGLGALVMRALTDVALEDGAGTGVLGATVQGRALYESLGWSVRAPLAGFAYRPAGAGTAAAGPSVAPAGARVAGVGPSGRTVRP